MCENSEFTFKKQYPKSVTIYSGLNENKTIMVPGCSEILDTVKSQLKRLNKAERYNFGGKKIVNANVEKFKSVSMVPVTLLDENLFMETSKTRDAQMNDCITDTQLHAIVDGVEIADHMLDSIENKCNSKSNFRNSESDNKTVKDYKDNVETVDDKTAKDNKDVVKTVRDIATVGESLNVRRDSCDNFKEVSSNGLKIDAEYNYETISGAVINKLADVCADNDGNAHGIAEFAKGKFDSFKESCFNQAKLAKDNIKDSYIDNQVDISDNETYNNEDFEGKGWKSKKYNAVFKKRHKTCENVDCSILEKHKLASTSSIIKRDASIDHNGCEFVPKIYECYLKCIENKLEIVEDFQKIKNDKNYDESINYCRNDSGADLKICNSDLNSDKCVDEHEGINNFESNKNCLISNKIINVNSSLNQTCDSNANEDNSREIKQNEHKIINCSKNPLEDFHLNSSLVVNNGSIEENTFDSMICDISKDDIESDLISSPVLNSRKDNVELTRNVNRCFSLDKFEKFEKVAFEMIENNAKIDKVNSQIIGGEMAVFANDTDNLEKCDDLLIRLVGVVETDLDTSLKNDIPLTCAVASDCEEQGDLNDSILVGFTTASHKLIEVPVNNYKRAEKLFSDLVFDDDFDMDVDPTDLKSVVLHEAGDKINTTENPRIPKSPTQVANLKIFDDSNTENISFSSKTVAKSKENSEVEFAETNMFDEHCFLDDIDFEENIEEKQTEGEQSEPIKFAGFKTASNKKVTISEKDLAKSKLIFSETEEMLKEQFDEASNKNIYISEQSLAKTKTLFADLDEAANIGNSNIGFKTASNKNINISKQSLAKTKTLFADLDEAANNGNPNIGFKTASNKNIYISEQSLAKTKTLFADLDEAANIGNSNIGFKTASNKNINISKQSLAKTKTLFADLDEAANNGNPNIGFKTASNKNINISEQSLAKTKTLFADLDEAANIGNSNIGFKTASYKNINISKQSLAKTKTLFADLDEAANIGNSNIGFKTASNKNINISEQSLAKTKTLFADLDEAANIGNSNIGFKTASNKNIYISEQSLAKTKTLFADLDEAANIGNSNIGFKTASNKNINISKQSLAKTKTLFADLDEAANNGNPNIGFKTASNKNINISEQSLAKTKTLFADLDEAANIGNSNIGFKTASNKNINISEQSLAKTKTLFADLDEAANIGNSNIGFKTASNKNINISKQSLAKTKTLFADLDEAENIGNSNIGFKTASNKNINISEQSLAKTKTLFADLDEAANTGNSNIGFKTASNKNITISEQSLAKTKTLFADLDKAANIGNSNIGFKAASNKNINISEQSLAKTKTLFADLDEAANTGNSNIGFKTASNKNITISEQSLAKTKTLFADLDEAANTGNSNIGFKTTSNKNINISEQSLAKTKTLFADLDEAANNGNPNISFKTAKNKSNIIFNEITNFDEGTSSKTMNDYDLKKIVKDSLVKVENLIENQDILIKQYIDTQAIDDFQNNDFTHETQIDKPGSPILHCPNARKRKKVFTVPYKKQKKRRIDKNLESINVINQSIKSKITNNEKLKKKDNNLDMNSEKEAYKFNENYKKTNKIYKLKDLERLERESSDTGRVSNDLECYKFDDLITITFEGNRNDVTNSKLTLDAVKEIFLKSVDRKIVPDTWFENHSKLILWKLISYEMRFRKCMFGCVSVRNLLEQLYYRYRKELDRCERPLLRMILERDEAAHRAMVLCVVRIIADGVAVSSVPVGCSTLELDLTDGWYIIRATIDKLIHEYVNAKKIKVGVKLLTCMAELIGCDEGISPFEDCSAVRLKLHGNSTLRAPWYARLGISTRVPEVKLSHLSPDGGLVTSVCVYVSRVYPALYVEKLADGGTVIRSERVEMLHANKHESVREAAIEALYRQIETEISQDESTDEESWHSGDAPAQTKRSKITHTAEFELSATQVRHLNERACRRREAKLRRIEELFREKLAAQTTNGCISRKVVQLLKFRAVCADDDRVRTCTVSVWSPGEHLHGVITEGSLINMRSVAPASVRFDDLQISAGRNSLFSKCQRKHFNVDSYAQFNRRCVPINELKSAQKTLFNEIDTIGLVVFVDFGDDSTSVKDAKNNHFVYLSDFDKNFVCIVFWGGVEKLGYGKIIEVGEFLYCCNVQRRIGNARKKIPQYRATEYTVLTASPKNPQINGFLKEFRDSFKHVEMNDFIEDCKELICAEGVIGNKSSYIVEDFSKYDFQSTFDTQNMKNEKIMKRIESLKRYGSPPPIANVSLINKSDLKDYVNPLSNNDKSSQRCSSPILPSGSALQVDDSETECDFHSEFDCSLPLSLD